MWFSLDPRTGGFVEYQDKDFIETLEEHYMLVKMCQMGVSDGFFLKVPNLDATVHIRHCQKVHRQRSDRGGVRDVVRFCGCPCCRFKAITIHKIKGSWRVYDFGKMGSQFKTVDVPYQTTDILCRTGKEAKKESDFYRK